ncbi:MAG: hypothetical protein AB8I08_19400 [Sandaracinaceae bacterium]
MRLSLCSSCARHARGAVCPFCGSGMPDPVEPKRVSRRDFTRTAVFTAGALVVGCGGSEGPVVTNTDGTTGDGSTGDEEELTMEERQQRMWEERDRQRGDCGDEPGGCAMPYGAPPDRPWV